MNHENLFEIAKIANEKGFKPNTLTTKVTNDYLLGGKNVLINDTCIYLWMCEVQMWLREEHSVHINIDFDLHAKTYEYTISKYKGRGYSEELMGDYSFVLMSALTQAIKKI